MALSRGRCIESGGLAARHFCEAPPHVLCLQEDWRRRNRGELAGGVIRQDLNLSPSTTSLNSVELQRGRHRFRKQKPEQP
ncbi:hypothetical protein CesoFtcFv8_007159 [Champsocephalus esox]|uniref:Uncharacterized protein n=2 Tax=Champsocephalus TaxID=52236 RepID=A0AAN8E0B3_CHAGU|nr:hypothetical protein CesoFtcFv8_007159 [Champsocephalus esox]KAK5927613.1 hypothetical protein CgunFtcFv8_012751 [Champsocephalus gunnari]